MAICYCSTQEGGQGKCHSGSCNISQSHVYGELIDAFFTGSGYGKGQFNPIRASKSIHVQLCLGFALLL